MIDGGDDGRHREVGAGRGLRCEEARVRLMGYLDGELEPRQARLLEDHLAVCVACRREELAYRRLGTLADSMGEGDGSMDVREAWETIYARIERRLGWVLVSMGLIVLTGFGMWTLMSEFLVDPEVPLIARFGVGAAAAGMIVLLVSFGRERLFRRKAERYTEVQR